MFFSKIQYVFIIIFYYTFLYNIDVFGQQPRVISGPMLGYSEHRECLIWIQTKCAKKIKISYINERDPQHKGEQQVFLKPQDPCDLIISKVILTGLEPGKTYLYKVFLDEQEYKSDFPLKFKTKELWEWRKDAPNFSFLTGSCLYINDSIYDRPGEPYGQSTKILKTMAETNGDFMLWLGDNTYLREVDYSSESGIKYRYSHTRRTKDLQKLLSTKNNYAIWDDHDFGPNNSNSTFELKEVSMQQFKEFWGNKTYGEEGLGIYSKFKWSDCDFYLLDNRYFRDENLMPDSLLESKTQLGEKQKKWLKQSLLNSEASFKFIVMGGQFLNTNTNQESYVYYQKERKEIIDFIIKTNIKNVVFLTGDRHHTEINKFEIVDTFEYKKQELPKNTSNKKKKSNSSSTNVISSENIDSIENNKLLFELTCSPLTSKGSNVLKTKEAINTMRIEQTLVTEPNFCQLNITGRKGNRNLLIRCFGATGDLKWEFTINQDE